MATGAQFVELTAKRLLGREDFRDRWFDFMRETVRENMEQTFRVAGVYDTALGLAADGANKVQITGSSKATDGQGHLLDPATAWTVSGLQFENTAAITYDVALHKTTRPNGIQINPRTGLPEYAENVEEVGERAEPNAVVDNGGGTITFTVDSVTEAGVSNAGRQVMVFRKAPYKDATTPAIAIEVCTVVWTGGQNKITTVGDLGQGAAISILATDYEVILLGPTIKRNTALASTGEHCFIGTVTGVGLGGTPATFNTSAQNVIDFSLSDIGDITKRDPVSGHIKIDVKSFATDSLPAITVRNTAGTPVFTVDKNGNLWVQGTTTQENVVQVNSSETITDNLTAGDNEATDSHTIKGSWSHLVSASTKFYVDGASGRVGIGGLDSVGYSLNVTGKSRFSQDIEPTVDNTVSLGTASKRFSDLFVVNLSFSGDFLPQIDDSQDIGSSIRRWQDGHFSRGIAIGDGNAVPLAKLHIDSTTTPHIRLERSDDATVAYFIDVDSNGDLIFSKSAAPSGKSYQFWNASDPWASTPFENGVQLRTQGLIEGAFTRYPRAGLYWGSTTEVNPTDLTFVLQLDNDGGALKSNLRFQTDGNGEIEFRTSTNEQMRIAPSWIGFGDSTPSSTNEHVKATRTFSSAIGAQQQGFTASYSFSAAEGFNKWAAYLSASGAHSSGTMGSISGAYLEGWQGGAGTVTTLRAAYANVGIGHASANVNIIRTVEIGGFAGGVGTVTNATGLYIGPITGGASSNHAIYTNDGLIRFGGGTIEFPSTFTATLASTPKTVLDAEGWKIANGLYVGSTGGTTYDNDAIFEGGIAVGFSGTDPAASTVYMGDADNWIGFNSGNPMWRVDANVPATNSNLWFDRTARVWSFVVDNGTKLQIETAAIEHFLPFATNTTDVIRNVSETNSGVRPVTDAWRVYQVPNTNWTGLSDGLLIEKTDANSLSPDGFIGISSWGTDGVTDSQKLLAAFQGNGNVQFPSGITYFNGTNTLAYDGVVQAHPSLYLAYNAGNPVLNFDANDYILYNRASNYMDFYCAGTHEMRLTSNGCEVVNGLAVGALIAPTDNCITIDNNGFRFEWNGTDPIFRVDTDDYAFYDRSANAWHFTWGTGSNAGVQLSLGDTSPLIWPSGTATNFGIGNFAANGIMTINGEGGVEIWGRAGSGAYPWVQCGPDGVVDSIYISSGFDTSKYTCAVVGRGIRITNEGLSESYDGPEIWAGDWTTSPPATSVFYLYAMDGDGDRAVGYLYESTGGVFTLGDVSDSRLKFNIAPSLVDGLWICKSIDPRQFNKLHANANLNTCGFIAQEVEAVHPQAVATGEFDEAWGFSPKSVAVSEIVPVAVRAINQLREMVETLQAQVATLQGQVATLQGYHA